MAVLVRKKSRRREEAAPPPPAPAAPPDGDWPHAAAFASDSFSSAAWLSGVVAEVLVRREGETAHEPYAFEHLDKLTAGLESLRATLAQRQQQQQAYAAELEAAAEEQERSHQAALSGAGASLDALVAQFGQLDARVARVGRTAAHVGDRLQVVDATRDRAERASSLITSLALFDTAGEPVLGEQFTAEARLGEAAALTKQLQRLAEEGAGAGLAGCIRAADKLRGYANTLENRLVRNFDTASSSGAVGRMAEAAAAMGRLNGDALLVARFVSTRKVFSQLGEEELPGDEPPALHDAHAALESEEDAAARAADALRLLGAHFKELLRTAKAEVALALRVFGAQSGPACAAQLVQRLLEQRVRAALERALDGPASGTDPSLPEPPSLLHRLSRLMLLAGAAERVSELAQRLAQLPGCGGGEGGFNAETAAAELFVIWREGYLEEEASVQAELHSGDPPGVTGVEMLLARAPDALARAALLLRTPRATALGVAQLCSALCQAAASLLTADLDGVAGQAAALCKLHTQATPQAQVAAEATGALLLCAGRGVQATQRLQVHLAQAAAPLLAGDAVASAQAASSAREAGAALEGALCRTLQVAVELGSAALERTLHSEQGKVDFAPRALGAGAPGEVAGMGASRPTVAAARVSQLARRLAECAVSAPLDDCNLAALRGSLALRLVAQLDAHYAHFSYTPAGGLRLRRDLEEYAELLERAWVLPPSCEPLRRIAELRALAQLLVAPPTALTALVNGEGLGLAVRREEAQRWLARRSDFRARERPFKTLLS